MRTKITGPVPVRSEEKERNQNRDIAVESLVLNTDEEVIAPELDIEDVHPIALDWYNSLRTSGQSKYFEPSDWQTARLAAWMMNTMLKSSRPSSEVYKALGSVMADLLATEGARRRVRLEIVRKSNAEKRAATPADSMRDAVKRYAAMVGEDEK